MIRCCVYGNRAKDLYKSLHSLKPRLIPSSSPQWSTTAPHNVVSSGTRRMSSSYTIRATSLFMNSEYTSISRIYGHHDHYNQSYRFKSTAAAEEVPVDDVDPSQLSMRVERKRYRRSGVRNVAIVAHVDHGKTTLVDQLLRVSSTVDGNKNDNDSTDRLLDSGDLEKERGITITSKVTRCYHKSNHDGRDDGSVNIINVVDTPGHAE